MIGLRARTSALHEERHVVHVEDAVTVKIGNRSGIETHLMELIDRDRGTALDVSRQERRAAAGLRGHEEVVLNISNVLKTNRTVAVDVSMRTRSAAWRVRIEVLAVL
jgi:hypothetical protein